MPTSFFSSASLCFAAYRRRTTGLFLLFSLLTLLHGASASASPTPYSGSAVAVASTGTTKVEAENYDKGGEGVAYHDTANGGDTAYRADNIGVEAGSVSNGYDVTYTASGEWDGYTLSVASAGTYTLSAALSSTSAGGTLHLEFGPIGQVGGTGVTKTAEFTVPNTGSFSTYQTLSVPGMALPSGLLWMRLVIDSQYPCKFDDFTLAAVPTLTSIVVSPASAALNLNGTQQFSAVAKDQNGNALATQPTFTWSVASGVGTVSSAGLYSAGATAGSASVTAKSGSVTGTASVTVTNAAPTVATAAAATPSSVTGTTTALSVLGADDGGEANLTYTWATTGTPPAAVSFSANGTNAAKNTTATLTKAGTYGFLVTLKDAGGLSVTSAVSVTVSQTLTALVVSPNPVTLNTGGTQQFAAAANDQFGNALATQPAISWSVSSGVGSITAAGLYSAGATAGTATVAAKSGTVTGTAAATVNAPAAGISLALVAAVNNQASLSWSSVSGAASYNVKRSSTNGSGYATVANVTTTSDIDQGLTNGTPYYYIVTAVTGTTESAPSNQVVATPTAQAFGFLNVGNGSVLSDKVTLYVSMASKAYGGEASPVTFSVDGVVFDVGGDLQEGSGNAGANTFFVLATDVFANGPHTLSVKDVNGNSATINVTFSNVLYSVGIPSMFDTSGNGLPTSAAITASLTSAQPWTVSIVTVDSANSVVQSFSGNSASINVAWNGKNSQGVEVADDAYEVDISYGSQSGTASSSAVSPRGAAQPIIRRNLLSKNKIGDCFIIMDEDAFSSEKLSYGDPSGNMIAYLKAIKADLAPSKGIVWNNLSVFPHSAGEGNLTAGEIQRIDNHFRTRLAVFYVYSHGGNGIADNGGGTFFNITNHRWRSTTFSSPNDSPMATLTQSANYGVNDPPALVFIDSCDSAGTSQVDPDLGFANDFDIGDGPSGFIGWGGFAIAYGDRPPPRDDWTFWRLDFWSQFTNFNQTYDTAYSNLQRDYNTHGHNWGPDPNNYLIYPDAQIVVDWLSGSAF